MTYERSEMLYDDGTHYKWDKYPDTGNAFYHHAGGNTYLDREEGYEVLYFINHIIGEWPLVRSVATCNKIERLLKECVPADITSHIEVVAWIVKYWGRN